jgi:hypothetical protein
MFKIKSQKTFFISGMSLVEIVVGSAIIMTSMVAIIGVYGNLTSMSLRNTSRIQAAMLVEETAEILRFMRDKGWSNDIALLENEVDYYIHFSNDIWLSSTTPNTTLGFFDRKFTLSPVYREVDSFDITSSGGTIDDGTRKAYIEVSWFDGGSTSSRRAELYLHNIFNN